MKRKIIICALFIIAFVFIILGVVMSINVTNDIPTKKANKKDNINIQIKKAIKIIDPDKKQDNYTYIKTDEEGNIVLQDNNNYEYIVDLKRKKYSIRYHQSMKVF